MSEHNAVDRVYRSLIEAPAAIKEEDNLYTTRIPTQGNGLRQAEPTDQEVRYERPFDAGVLPEDLFNSGSSRATVYPEAALMCAVLEDALDCFQKQFISGTKRAERLGHEAEEWLFSDDSDWVFSFISICTALDLGPEYIRRGLKSWHGRRRDRSQKKRPHVVRVQRRLVA